MLCYITWFIGRDGDGVVWHGWSGMGKYCGNGLEMEQCDLPCNSVALSCQVLHYAACENTLTALAKGWCKNCAVGQCESENVLSVAR